MMTKRKITALLGGTAAALLLALPAAAQDFTLRFNHVLGPQEPYHEGFKKWAERVKPSAPAAGSGSRSSTAPSSASRRTSSSRSARAPTSGQNTDSARLGNYVPGIAVVNGPYFVTDKEEAFALADSADDAGQWLTELADEHGIKVVCFDWVQGFRNFFTNKPIRTPRTCRACASARRRRRSGRSRSARSAPSRWR
jgi:TRAP-type transport system periplasmic protein